MSKSKPLVFFGNERFATGVGTKAPVLSALIAAGYPVATVVVSHAEARSRKTRPLEVAEMARNNDIALLPADEASPDRLKEIGAEVAILAAYGRIVPAEIIGIFPKGIINLHPSLLPKYRGPTPIEQTILNGDNESGVSLMKLAPKMDTGPVFAQKTLALSGQETKQELADKLGQLGADTLIGCLPAILDDSLTPVDQDETAATYTKLLTKSDGRLDTDKPAVQLEREVRAYAGWPRSQMNIFGHEVIVTKTRLVESGNESGLFIKCSPGYLEVTELIAPSGRTMTGRDFILGYKN